jgi:hypothetical protein
MATWKKVIVSGSNAELNQLNVGSSQQITTSPSTTSLSGSFSGSFNGAINTVLAQAGRPNFVAYDVATGTFSYANTGSFTATSASYALNADLLDGRDSTTFTSTSSFQSYTSSNDTTNTNQNTRLSSLEAATASLFGATSSLFSATASLNNFTASQLVLNGKYATTGSNTFIGTQTITGSVVITSGLNVLGGLTGSLLGTSSFANNATSASYAATAQQATSASFASTAAQVNNALSFGTGLTGGSYNGSTAVTTAISGAAALTANNSTKWSGTGFVNSNIVDTGTQVQIGAGASSGVSIAAGGINVTGNSIFNNNLTISGDLTVAGTASFTNTDNLTIRDKFILINSGSSTLADSGWITQYNAAGSGSAFYLDAASTGNYGRFAVAYDVIGTSTALTADEFVVTAKTAAGIPSLAPTWGGATNGNGNMFINSSNGDIYIYS